MATRDEIERSLSVISEALARRRAQAVRQTDALSNHDAKTVMKEVVIAYDFFAEMIALLRAMIQTEVNAPYNAPSIASRSHEPLPAPTNSLTRPAVRTAIQSAPKQFPLSRPPNRVDDEIERREIERRAKLLEID